MSYKQFLVRLRDPRLKGVSEFILEFVNTIRLSEVGPETESVCSGPRIHEFIAQIVSHLRCRRSLVVPSLSVGT